MSDINHLDNFCNQNKNPIPPPTHLTEEEARALNLVSTLNFSKNNNFGQKIFDIVNEEEKFTILQIVPAKDAIPNKNGTLAFIKIRGGSFSTHEDASRAAIKIVAEQDQLSKNYIVPIGCPLPIYHDMQSLSKKDTIFVDLKTAGVNQEWRWLLQKEKEFDQQIQKEVEIKAEKFQEKILEEESQIEKYSKSVVTFVDLMQKFQTSFDENSKLLDKLLSLKNEIYQQDNKFPNLKDEFISFIENFDKESGYIRGKTVEMDNILDERKEKLLNSTKLWQDLFQDGKCICHKIPKFV